MPSSSNPAVPTPVAPRRTWKHYALYQRIKEAVASLPIHFDTETYIEGMSATDIFALNSALGATIEEQVVATLNRIRASWDPDDKYALYGFVRQPQTFPDVVLRRFSPKPSEKDDIILGVELKGWYLLSKEGEPSFRYTATPKACADPDLLVCVPWALKNVLSGRPKVFKPYIESAKRAAQLRNFHWEHVRKTTKDRSISPPKGDIHPYPNKADEIHDKPAYDAGGNFGRYARTGIMDDYLEATLQTPLCGIPAGAWLGFFKLFTESSAEDDIRKRISGLRARLSEPQGGNPSPTDVQYLAILEIIEASL